MIGRTVLILYLLLFTPENPGLSAEDKPYNTKPYDFAASEIIGNKVVMLAENGALGHYNLFPYITFIKIIKSWNAQLKEEKIHNKTLSLIIEKSPKAVSLIRHYIDSGDIDPFLDKMGNSSSLEELYLFYKLKELNKEIIRNGNRLKISGFEISERYEDEYFFKRSEEERNIFHTKYRDSLLFEGIRSYIINNPEDYILITYGNAHLEEGYTSKSQSAADNSGKGYYLAYYLRREFGKRFVTVDQTFIENEDFNYGKKLAYLKDKDFLVKKNDPLFLGKVPFSELKTDFTIIRHDGLAGPRFIRYIFSRNCLKRNYNVLVEFEQLCKKYNKTFSLKYSEKINPNVLNALLSIKLITGKEFDSILDYKTYLDSTENSFYHDRIFTEEISNDLFNYIKNNPRDMNFRNMLYSIGFAPWYISPDFNPSENDWKTNDWNNSLPYLNYFDYAGLFWIGNTLEKEKARKFLKDFTKQDFTEAAEYLEWYYKNIFEYKF